MLPLQKEIFEQLKTDFLITETKAYEMLKKYPVERLHAQVEAFPFREDAVTGSRAGFLIRAIEENYSFPEGYLENLKQKESANRAAKRQTKIDDCAFCDQKGWRNVKSERDTFYGVLHQCTHDPKTEAQFEEHAA